MAKVKSDQERMASALEEAGERPADLGGSGKIPYSGRLSNTVARMFADVLYQRHKSLGRLATGETKTDVGGGSKKRIDLAKRSELRGTELDVSIKTINFPDGKSRRYTKNMERAARELGDEAASIHRIMPFAVVVGVVLVRAEACDDAHPKRTGSQYVSSFSHGVFTFRKRGGRLTPADDPWLCERVFLGFYEWKGEHRGVVRFLDVTHPPPRKRRPSSDETLSLSAVADAIQATWAERWEAKREFAPDEVS